jgi:hypothetical protein
MSLVSFWTMPRVQCYWCERFLEKNFQSQGSLARKSSPARWSTRVLRVTGLNLTVKPSTPQKSRQIRGHELIAGYGHNLYILPFRGLARCGKRPKSPAKCPFF